MTEHHPSAPPDLGLSVPIRGVQLIQASAGTGKTFTLATLYARLVIECALPVSMILAVTFTEAATKELRERLRHRLVRAQQLAEAWLASDGNAQNDASSNDEGTRLTARLVHAAIAREGARALCQRLRVACQAMDLAPIYTIHSFCRRALADHALEAGQPLVERALAENETLLREEVATDFWRQVSHTPDSARTLVSIWESPGALAKSLRELLTLDALLPIPAESIDDGSEAALAQAQAIVLVAYRIHGAQAKAAIDKAMAGGVMDGNRFRKSTVASKWATLNAWVDGGGVGDLDAGIVLFGSSAIRERTKKAQSANAPVSPLFDAIEAWSTALADVQTLRQQRRIAMIHNARDYARQRLATIKRERGLIGYNDMIEGLAQALENPANSRLAERLRTQYRVALLDEFQDTDSRQWSIFRRLFGEHGDTQAPSGQNATSRALFLIGDPKQAIYRFRGGDVFTYLAAAKSADARHSLTMNFRSRPAMLSAVQALFELSGPDAFAQEGIGFEPVRAGERCDDAHLQIDGGNAPALNFLVLPETADEKESIESARTRATRACVAAIHSLLEAGIAGRAKLRDKHGQWRAIAPGDIAVLVEKNDDAASIQQALAAAGIPSVAAGRESLYDTEEAQHLRWLLQALSAPADDERLRAALAAPLFGLDAAAIAALDTGQDTHRHWQDRLQRWRQRTERHGPMALIGQLCAENAARLLTLIDGERRLSNYLQLAEQLQDSNAHALGLTALLDTLEQRILAADDNNDAELLRLESDAARVTILTLHKSKGLEFELVFLPYAATNGAPRKNTKPPMAKYHDGTRQVAMLYPDDGGTAKLAERDEQHAEKLRLLYVGLTRARLATWVVWGVAKDARNTPMAWLLHRDIDADKSGTVTNQTIEQRLAKLQAHLADTDRGAIATIPAASTLPTTRLRFDIEDVVPAAAQAQRTLDRDWWVYSFSQLAREDAGFEAGSADDEAEPAPDMLVSRLSGPRFGNSLHTALEQVSVAKWRDWFGDLPPPGEFDLLANALRGQGFASENDLLEGVPLLTQLIANTLNVRLPEGTRLAMLPEASLCNEMEFHFALANTAVPELLDTLHAHGIVPDRQTFGSRKRLEGLLTGRIDLVYEADDRYYVLDYKSNQLPDYAPVALEQAVRESEYDLQYVLYTLALHRWLRFRLGAAYRIEQHLGGVRYLFCRGLDCGSNDSPGIHALTLPPALILALDALFQGTAENQQTIRAEEFQ